MKRIFIHSTLALTLAAGTAFAQQTTPAPTDSQNSSTPQRSGKFGHHRQFDAHKAAEHMGKRLNLTSDQTAKLEPILSENQQKMRALHADTSLTPDQRKEQFQALRQNFKTQLSGVLTPDQMQQLQSMRRGMRGAHRRGGQQPETSAPPAGL